MAGNSKIKSKDLSYVSSLPPFLQRLQEQRAGSGDPDRHEQPLGRPRRAKNPDDDDGPTLVDESGETVSKEDFERLSKGDDSSETKAVALSAPDLSDDHKPTRKDAKLLDAGVAGASKKRKAAKVIADDGATDVTRGTSHDDTLNKMAKKVKKKTKPIKLAFDDG